MKIIALAILVTALAQTACTTKKGGKRGDEIPATPAHPVEDAPVEASRSKDGLLDVKAELRDDGLLLHVGMIPAGSTVECDMDLKPLVPCHDGALFARPAIGDHKINAVAIKGGRKVAFGESATFTVAPGASGADEPDAKNPLTLAVADPGFRNGMTVPLNKSFVAPFKFVAAPGCDAKLKCSYDSRTSPFWTDCDANAASFTINKDLLAAGLQYLSAQASCGDRLGPILTIFFYGVPEDYQPMMLRDVQDANGRHIANLVKADDCPESQQKFECAETADEKFGPCTNGNVVDAPAAGFRIRILCDGRPGPALSLIP